MNKQFFTSNGGYTLVEVLVAIMIVTLMLTIGVASYREFSTRQALQSVGRQIIGDLRLTQEEALAGKKPVGACQVLDGYRFIISGSSYSVVANCDGSLAVTRRPMQIFFFGS
jgi:type IV fimbrial biogenesis protein FimT